MHIKMFPMYKKIYNVYAKSENKNQILRNREFRKNNRKKRGKKKKKQASVLTGQAKKNNTLPTS